jgi:TonB-dependent receptor
MRTYNLKYPILILLFILLSVFAIAQNSKLVGKVVDAETGAPLVGASVAINGTSRGTTADVEGRFFLQLEKGKQYSLKISSVGYQPKNITDVTGDNNGNTLEIALKKATASLEAVVVTSSVRRESSASLYLTQKNSSTISDGISAEAIKRSPDKNTSDVLKRVSGASIQDNKFVVIRGLNERYNIALLNNAALPSTEADKKAFSFDILPSSVIDNVTIYKSATPDLPGDFSGGAVKVSTRDYPSKPVSDLSFSIGYNSLTTFQNFYKGFPTGKYDWLGYFDNSRLIPNSYYQNRSNFINLSTADKNFVTKQFSNTYGYEAAYKSMPDIKISYTGGNTKLLKGSKKIGYIYSINYGSSRNLSDRTRDEYQTYDVQDYLYNTNNYAQNSNLSALLNLTYSYSKSKISLKTLYNNSFSKAVGIRSGFNIINGAEGKFLIKSTNTESAGNGIFNSVLEGIHSLNHGWNVDWNASYGNTYRWEPDQKILAFHTEPGADIYNLTLSNENSPEITNAGRVYSFLTENIYGANINATKSFTLWGQAQKFKIGTSNYYRDRNFEANALGYALSLDAGAYRVSIPETKTTTFNNIFSPGNIDQYQLTVANIPANSIGYNGTALMNAGYIMFDNKFSSKLRLTWGARVENYGQKLTAENKSKIDHSNFDVLPSFVLTYGLTPKTNLRLAGSQAVNRPEFRELADYRVYDYNSDIILLGNPALERCKNTNADLRYEWFPSGGEIISASLFYKYFTNPIEQVNEGNNVLSWANATNATAYGAEIELRKKLSFIGSGFFNHLTVYTNAAYIKGSVQFDTTSYNSPMQGQSPYLINAGLFYSTDNDNLSFNLLYNRIGSRLRYRAILGATRDIFEKPRDVIDLQISKKFMDNKLETRLSVGDILAQSYTWYYKYTKDASKIAYDPATDRKMQTIKNGTNITLTVRYSLGK